MTNSNNIQEDLEKIYADVSEWVKFAEAKHAAALALWTALIVAVISLDGFAESMKSWVFCAVLIILVIGMLINVVSFVPFLNMSKVMRRVCYWWIDNHKPLNNNLIFYQNIFLMVGGPTLSLQQRCDNYKNKLKSFNLSIPQDVRIDSYIEQIVSVSEVAAIKMFLFDIVARYIFVLLLLGVVCIVIA